MFPIFPQNRFGGRPALHFWFVPLIAAGIAATASTVGSIVSAKSAQSEGKKTRDYNAEQAAVNREWQERMSNTAYQRGMADMEKAGLNPMLAAWSGGASTPGGSQASVGINTGVSSAISQGASGIVDSMNGVSNAMHQMASAKEASASASNLNQQTKVLREDEKLTAEKVKTQQLENKVLENSIPKSKFDARTYELKNENREWREKHFGEESSNIIQGLEDAAGSNVFKSLSGTFGNSSDKVYRSYDRIPRPAPKPAVRAPHSSYRNYHDSKSVYQSSGGYQPPPPPYERDGGNFVSTYPARKVLMQPAPKRFGGKY